MLQRGKKIYMQSTKLTSNSRVFKLRVRNLQIHNERTVNFIARFISSNGIIRINQYDINLYRISESWFRFFNSMRVSKQY